MCQLTLTDFANENLNNLWLFYSLLHNTKFYHKDGYGMFFNKKDIFKSEKCPQNIENLSDIIQSKNHSSDLILSHVRQISVGKVPRVEDSHPFEKDNIVLFHNGTLKWKFAQEVYKGIDSEQFAGLLSDTLTKEPNFVMAIKDAYNKFTGKFAFLIYNKLDNKVYVVRGKSAKLHKADFYLLQDEAGKEVRKYYGTVINTELESLKDTCSEFANILQLLYNIIIEADITEIKEEKIYEYEGNGSLKELDTIKENYEQYIVKNVELVDKDIELIINTIRNQDLSILDLDLICYAKLKKGLAYLNKEELKTFVENFIGKSLAKWNNADKKSLWYDLKLYIKTIDDYLFYDLKYPYMLNSKYTLEKVLDKIEKELEIEEGVFKNVKK